jgi:hypothetical protein
VQISVGWEGGDMLLALTAVSLVLAAPPVNTDPPVISGPQEPFPGSVLTATPGTWTGAASVEAQWVHCDLTPTCVPVAQGGTSYTVQASDVGFGIEYLESARSADGETRGVYSSSSPIVRAPRVVPVGDRPANQTVPKLTGWRIVGQTMTITTGTWSGTPPITYSYQWQRCNRVCSDIAGATGPSYAATAADLDFFVACLVTATNALGAQGIIVHSALKVGQPGGGSVPIAATQTDLLRAAIPKGKAATAAQLLKHKGYGTKFRWRKGGTLNLRWTADGIKVAEVQDATLYHYQRPIPVKLKLTAAGRRLLRSNPHPTLTIEGAFLPANSNYPVLVKATRTL